MYFYPATEKKTTDGAWAKYIWIFALKQVRKKPFHKTTTHFLTAQSTLSREICLTPSKGGPGIKTS